MTDHDLLVKVAQDVEWLKTSFKNHLKHHFLATLSAIGIAATAIATLLVQVLQNK